MIQKLETLYQPDDRVKIQPIIYKEDRCDLSVIIPTYNMVKYIRQCILSVINQKTGYKIEVIVINDGSTDNTQEIIEKIAEKDNRIIIYSHKNAGLSAARNIGLNIATGKYVYFLDADDQMLDGGLQEMIDKAYKTGCDIVQCNYLIKRKGKILDSGWKPKKLFAKTYDDMRDIPGYATMKVIKRSLFNDVRFPENYRYEDTIMRLRIFGKCKNGIFVVDKPLYVYLINQAGITQSKKNDLRRIDAVCVIDKLLKGLSKEDIKIEYDEILHHVSSIAFHRIKFLNKKYKKSIFEHICDMVISFGLHTENEELKKFEKIIYERNYTKYILMGVKNRW